MLFLSEVVDCLVARKNRGFTFDTWCAKNERLAHWICRHVLSVGVYVTYCVWKCEDKGSYMPVTKAHVSTPSVYAAE